MEVSTATLQPSCSFPLRAPKTATGDRFSSLSSIRTSPKSISLSCSITKGCDLVVKKPVRLRWSSVVAATVGDTTAVQNSCSSGQELPVSDSSNPTSVEDQPSGNGAKEKEKGGVGGLDDRKTTRVCDKLIEVFLVDKPTPTDWRRLLAFSKEWDDIRPHFYKWCQDRADTEDDPGMKHKLLRLGRKLKEIDEDVQRHNELLKVIRGAQSEISEIVSRRCKDFTQEFFVHLHTVTESYYDNPTEQTELKFQDIINSPTVDTACRKIDHLAEKNQLDSALVMMITKAWSAAKDSSMTKDEVKDILYHLYVIARGNLQRLMPKEIRILKYLLTIEDTEERLAALHDAFTLGEELEGTDDAGAASHLDEGYCGCLPFQPGRHSNKGSKRPHEPKDHSKNGGAEEVSRKQVLVTKINTTTDIQENSSHESSDFLKFLVAIATKLGTSNIEMFCQPYRLNM